MGRRSLGGCCGIACRAHGPPRLAARPSPTIRPAAWRLRRTAAHTRSSVDGRCALGRRAKPRSRCRRLVCAPCGCSPRMGALQPAMSLKLPSNTLRSHQSRNAQGCPPHIPSSRAPTQPSTPTLQTAPLLLSRCFSFGGATSESVALITVRCMYVPADAADSASLSDRPDDMVEGAGRKEMRKCATIHNTCTSHGGARGGPAATRGRLCRRYRAPQAHAVNSLGKPVCV